ncbi:MAG TPA: hypothetical protein VFP37_15260 [Steroidobacteraceae bacterium]|nr:hypothetical protein [Steroidobacteraceae bacterium]
MKRILRALLPPATALFAGLATAHDIDLQAAAEDPARDQVAHLVSKGRDDVETFFKARFPETIHVTVAASRAGFNQAFPAAWGMSQTECWMVGVGVADFLVLLSPSAWAREACDHDPADASELQRIVTHELVHVFHGQRNPSRDFTGAEELGWFIEGLAVLASGQLEAARLARTTEAVRAGDVPKTLNDAWSGPHRYGRAGSIVQYLDEKYGRTTLIALLPLVKQADLLARLGISEQQLLRDWQSWLLSRPRQP